MVRKNQASSKDATGVVNTSNLAVKSDFIALKDEFDKLNINKLVNVVKIRRDTTSNTNKKQ